MSRPDSDPLDDDDFDDDFDPEIDVDTGDLIDIEDLQDEDIDVKARLRTVLAKLRNIMLVVADNLDMIAEVVEEMD